MNNTTTLADTLAIVRTLDDALAGEMSSRMLAAMSHDELLTTTTNLLALVHLAREVGTDLTLDEWCAAILNADDTPSI